MAAIFLRVTEKFSALVVKLAIQVRAGVGFFAQGRATERSANQREMDARLRISLAQDAMLQIIQRRRGAPEADDLFVSMARKTGRRCPLCF